MAIQIKTYAFLMHEIMMPHIPDFKLKALLQDFSYCSSPLATVLETMTISRNFLECTVYYICYIYCSKVNSQHYLKNFVGTWTP